MRYLILSDIHSNWEALEGVLSAAKGQYDEIVCCGDFIGYGADPNRVIDWARENVSVAVRGNHDKACVELADLEWFNPVARAATIWTHHELTPANKDYVRNLAKGPAAVNGFEVVHGSPLNEDEYIVSTSEAAEAFGYVNTRVVFFGHTHLQGGFELSGRKIWGLSTPSNPMLLDLNADSAYLLNPGSVGQPRDEYPEAGYILYDPEDQFLFYHRIAYDVVGAQEKIRKAGLPGLLADRLAIGR
ncbi:MAG: metallophosphoesterase [Bryobacterales bacterium]|nr:metallophosphoesterase [Bryobacterales bacterium]